MAGQWSPTASTIPGNRSPRRGARRSRAWSHRTSCSRSPRRYRAWPSTGRPGQPWNDSLFLGALAQRQLIRLQLQGDRVVAEERLLQDLGERIRDVRLGPDGNLYLVTDEDDGKLLRLEPPRG